MYKAQKFEYLDCTLVGHLLLLSHHIVLLPWILPCSASAFGCSIPGNTSDVQELFSRGRKLAFLIVGLADLNFPFEALIVYLVWK